MDCDLGALTQPKEEFVRFRNRFLFVLALSCTLALTVPARGQEEQEIADAFIRQLVDFTAIVLEEMDPNQPGVCYPKRPNDHNQTPGYPMAYLYKTRHPLNPYQGDRKIRDTAIAITDKIAQSKTLLEWPLYNLCQTYQLLRDDVPAAKARQWKEYAGHYVSIRGIRPFSYTSPNHEAWNALAILRAGQVFGERGWVVRAGQIMHQLIKLQTDLGYFDEGMHHGPSMKYNQVQLAPMLLYYDYSKDEAVLAASKRLANFMIRYSFPDGSPIGALDGRQSYSLGYFGTLCYGLDRWPLGKEINRRIFRTRKNWGVLNARSPYHNLSDWYAYFGFGLVLDEYLSLKADALTTPLPQDKDGYRMVERGPSFSAGVVRRHDWMVALSGILSDVPRLGTSPYQLERQSRLDVWHKKTGLIIGGGHNMRGDEVPLANFVLVTGFRDVNCDFGRVTGGETLDRQALYFPRNIRTSFEPDRQLLTATFGTGDVSLDVRPLDNRRLEVRYEYEVLASKKLFIQLPLIVWRDGTLLLDGTNLDGIAPAPVKKTVEIRNAVTASAVHITLPEGTKAMVRGPILPLRWYGADQGEQRYHPYYKIFLLSVLEDASKEKGRNAFQLEIREK